MVKRNKKTKPPADTRAYLSVPDEAVDFVVRRFLVKRGVEGVDAVIGIRTDVVEKVLELFVAWADQNNYIKNGVLTIGGPEGT